MAAVVLDTRQQLGFPSVAKQMGYLATQHRAGYERYPVETDEFAPWEAEQLSEVSL